MNVNNPRSGLLTDTQITILRLLVAQTVLRWRRRLERLQGDDRAKRRLERGIIDLKEMDEVLEAMR